MDYLGNIDGYLYFFFYEIISYWYSLHVGRHGGLVVERQTPEREAGV